MVVHNPNNWHWVDKNCLPWAKEYFATQLPKLELSNNQFKITNVNVTGDCDVSNRKGKVICIYDMVLDITLQSEETTGTLKVKEFIHDEQEYEYEYSNFGATKALVQSQIVPEIQKILWQFQDDLIKSQEEDLQLKNVAHE